MNSKVFFKIIVPNYNNMPYIKKCLDSILQQTFKDFFVVVVDDLSTDCSDKFCEAYERIYPDKLKLLRLDKKGYAGSAKNRGLEYNEVKSEYIWFVDSDDWLYDSTVLQKMHDKIVEANMPELLRIGAQIWNGKTGRYMSGEKTLEAAARSGKCAPWWNCIKSKFASIKFAEDRAKCNDVLWFARLLDAVDPSKVAAVDSPCYVYNVCSSTSAQHSKAKHSNACKEAEALCISDIRKYLPKTKQAQVFKDRILENNKKHTVAQNKSTVDEAQLVKKNTDIQTKQQSKDSCFFKIIVPNYNNMPYIKKCLDSILNQTFQDFKIVVVDDMSTDSSDKFCEAYAKKYPDKIVYKQLKKKGYAGTCRNVGLEYPIKCEYIWFVDSDDWLYDNNVLKEMHSKIIKTNKPDMLNLSFISANGNFIKAIKDKNLAFAGQAPWRKCIKDKFKICKFLPNRAICNDVIWFGRLLDIVDFNKVEVLEHPCIKYNKSATSGWFGEKTYNEQQQIKKSLELLEQDLKNEQFKTEIGIQYRDHMLKNLPKLKANRLKIFNKKTSRQNDNLLPYVTVILTTHNRTNVACETIKYLVKNLKYSKLKWCISDDRSHEDHIKKLLEQFSLYGIKDVKVCKTSNEKYGLGASMNNGLKYAWTISDIALTCEDDWILTKPLDIEQFVKEMMSRKIALIKLATKNSTICDITKYNDQLSIVSIKDSIIKNNIESWLYNNQVALRHKYVFDKIGYYKENCESYEQEVDFDNKFKKISNYGKNYNFKVLVLNTIKANLIVDESLYFIHIGKFSSRECNRKYNIPKKFEYFCMLDRKDEISEIEQKARQYAINVQHLDIINPKTYQDKIGIIKTTYNELKTICSDKILVKEYVTKKLGVNICPMTIDVQADPKYLKLNLLPNKFVLKCNHGCGYNIIVKDKLKLDFNKAIQQLDIWLKEDFFDKGKEIQYHFINRKVFAEEFVGNINEDTVDYKFLCFNGKPKYCGIINDRSNDKRRLNYYDMNFNFVDICRLDFPNNSSMLDKKPILFEDMKAYATKLSEDFDFVRVDFYIHNNKVYLGELTFSPGNGRMTFKNPQHGIILGNMLNLK